MSVTHNQYERARRRRGSSGQHREHVIGELQIKESRGPQITLGHSVSRSEKIHSNGRCYSHTFHTLSRLLFLSPTFFPFSAGGSGRERCAMFISAFYRTHILSVKSKRERCFIGATRATGMSIAKNASSSITVESSVGWPRGPGSCLRNCVRPWL